MNDLSWIMYLIDVLGSLNTVSEIGAFVFSLILVGVVMFQLLIHDALEEPEVDTIRRTVKYVSWITLGCFVAAILTPSTDTLYLIAASEIGETAFANEEVREVFVELKSAIMANIKVLGGSGE